MRWLPFLLSMGLGSERMVGHTKVDLSLHSGLSPPSEMHQTQTFVHLIILLLPRARREPQPVKSMQITTLLKILLTIVQAEGSRHGSENRSKRPA